MSLQVYSKAHKKHVQRKIEGELAIGLFTVNQALKTDYSPGSENKPGKI